MVFRRRKPPGVTSTVALGRFHSWPDRFIGRKVLARYFQANRHVFCSSRRERNMRSLYSQRLTLIFGHALQSLEF